MDMNQFDVALIVGTAIFVLISGGLVALFIFKKDPQTTTQTKKGNGGKKQAKKGQKGPQAENAGSRSISFAPTPPEVKKPATNKKKAQNATETSSSLAKTQPKAQGAQKPAKKQAPNKSTQKQAKKAEPAPQPDPIDDDGFEQVLTKKEKRQQKPAAPTHSVVVQTRGTSVVAVAQVPNSPVVPAQPEAAPAAPQKSKSQLKKERRQKEQAKASSSQTQSKKVEALMPDTNLRVDKLKNSVISKGTEKEIEHAQEEKGDIKQQIQKRSQDLQHRERELSRARRAMLDHERALRQEEKARKVLEKRVATLEKETQSQPKKSAPAKKKQPEAAPKPQPKTFVPVDVQSELKKAQELKKKLARK